MMPRLPCIVAVSIIRFNKLVFRNELVREVVNLEHRLSCLDFLKDKQL